MQNHADENQFPYIIGPCQAQIVSYKLNIQHDLHMKHKVVFLFSSHSSLMRYRVQSWQSRGHYPSVRSHP
jgi:hypothetical protein